MIRQTIIINKFLLALMLMSFSGCETDISDQIGQDTKVMELQNGLDLVVTTFSYGLNGQHKRVVLSKDSLREVQIQQKTYPILGGYSRVLILDTLPAAILYSSYEPENLETIDQFLGKLIYKKVGGSDLDFMSRSANPNILEVVD